MLQAGFYIFIVKSISKKLTVLSNTPLFFSYKNGYWHAIKIVFLS